MLRISSLKIFFRPALTALVIIGAFSLAACNSESQPDTSKQEPSAGDDSAGLVYTAQDLRNASLRGRTGKVREMIGQGMDVNASDNSGRTPLMLASFNGHTEIVQLLLEEGADVSARNTDGRTPLIFASSGPFPETVALLLESDADPNAVDNVDGWSALMFAAAEGNKEVVTTLLDHGADPSLTDKDDESAIDFARNNDHSEVVQVLEEIK
ncbi:ankyrin repeat domain-containing protein [Fodinibius sediminis]|uniref:Ankyrin repeat n=1 Tax=Fodinibius sediminis TaxID=1214077 RepID=A0A521D9Z6_9BACT|nr:ankyrin repeat domain-containing protein [Fodinibius sediminis]SMO68473.1 Ankyrin repeat [Fodinibius sediminis]